MSERQNVRTVESLERWFAAEQRPLPWRPTYDPYEVWVAEVMAQQTRMEVVLRYWEDFLRRFPTIHELAAADEESVLAAWSGLGYYRRARMLREGAIEVVERFGGSIPDDPELLESIRGIGPYTAGAIASIAFNRAVPIVDGNILRVLSRVALLDDPLGSRALERSCRDLAAGFVKLAEIPRNFNQALMELGATICTPRNPSCAECPIRTDCGAFAARAQSEFPRPRIRSKPVEVVVPTYVVSDSGGRVMLIRGSGGALLEGMFLLPGDDDQAGITFPVSGIERLGRIGHVRHTITNRRIRFEVWDAVTSGIADAEGQTVRWVRPDELASVPHPSWVRKVIELRERRDEA